MKQRTLFLLIITIGIVLRTVIYIVNNSFWYDETLLAYPVIESSFGHLFLPLRQGQVIAPIGFLIVTKFFALALGNHEYTLRLFPFACGILSVFIFWRIAKAKLKPDAAVWTTILFSFSYYAIQHAAEYKHYASDIFFALVLLGCALWVESGRLSVLKYAAALISGALSIWFSFPSAILLFCIGGYLLINSFLSRDYIKIKCLFPIICVWAISGIFYYAGYKELILGKAFGKSYLEKWWLDAGGFPNFTSFSLENLLWPVKSIFLFFDNPIGIFPIIGLLLYTVGMRSLWHENKRFACLLVSPVIVSLLLAIAGIYPFKERVVIFLIPFVIITMAYGIAAILRFISKYTRYGYIIIFFLVIMKPLMLFVENPIMHIDGSKKAIRYIQDNWQADDQGVIVGSFSYPQFEYYTLDRYIPYHIMRAHTFGISDRPSWANSRNELKEYGIELSKLTNSPQPVWIFITDDPYKEKEYLISFLAKKGELRHRYSSKNAHVYSYKLKETKT